jgi:hypothetical protein
MKMAVTTVRNAIAMLSLTARRGTTLRTGCLPQLADDILLTAD